MYRRWKRASVLHAMLIFIVHIQTAEKAIPHESHCPRRWFPYFPKELLVAQHNGFNLGQKGYTWMNPSEIFRNCTSGSLFFFFFFYFRGKTKILCNIQMLYFLWVFIFRTFCSLPRFLEPWSILWFVQVWYLCIGRWIPVWQSDSVCRGL